MEVEIVTKASSILADTAVLCATWMASGSSRALARRIGGANALLADVLVAAGMASLQGHLAISRI